MSSIPRTPLQLIKQMVKPYKWRVAGFFSLTFLGSLAWTASPLVIAVIITRLSEGGTIDSAIWALVWLYAGLRIIDEVLWRTAEALMLSFKPQMVESIRTNLFAAILKKPHSYFIDSSSGRVGHWINQTASTTNNFIDTTIWTVWGRLVGLIISAGFLFTAHWSLATLFIVWLVLLFGYNQYRGKKFSRLISKRSDEISKVSGTVIDSVSNHLSVRVYNAQEREAALVESQQRKVVTSWRAAWRHNLVTNMVKGQSASAASIIALILVLYLYSQQIVNIGDIVLFIAYFGDASNTLWQLAWSFNSYFENFGTIQNALDGLQGVDERQSPTQKNLKKPKTVSLELRNISFAYPENTNVPVIKNLNLTIPAGTKVGLVGHSGAGKSTLVGLLLGLYEPTEGEIIINNKPVLEHSPSFLRSFSSYVPQDTNLFNRSLAENVGYAVPSATKKQLHQALLKAEALEFAQNLPHGLDTIIGERGVKLSGGQRQRVAIARAILQDAPLVLLDEATSALDSVSEQAIQKALHTLMADRTAIVIAHRLSTLKHLDSIIVIEDGQVVEHGSHQQLLKKQGVYADLWKRQKDGFIVE